MITTKEIVKAVNAKLKAGLPDMKIKSTDIRKNVEPGSLYVEYPLPMFDGTEDLRHEAGTIRICYFPADEYNYRIEFADMQKKLSELFFGSLKVAEHFTIPINELEFEQSDGVLLINFDYETWQYVTETGDDMEHIEVRQDMEHVR